jgi:hypothetical protein
MMLMAPVEYGDVVEAAQPFDRVGDDARALLFIGDVILKADRDTTRFPGGLLADLTAAGGERHVRTGGAQPPAIRADSRGSTDHEHPPSASLSLDRSSHHDTCARQNGRWRASGDGTAMNSRSRASDQGQFLPGDPRVIR